MISFYSRAAVLVLVSLLVPVALFAQTDTFTISALIGDDTVSPTTPTNVVAAPLSTSQIDVTWTASTDNLTVGGYQFFRDTIQIATTTLTSFSDTGLAANTLYSYSIRAFDTSGNVSTSSVAVATTTNAIIVPPATTTTSVVTGGSQSTRTQNIPGEQSAFLLTDWEVKAGDTDIAISFTTNIPVRSSVRWGESADYELGYSVDAALKKNHSVYVNDLDSGAQYSFEIVLYNGLNEEVYRSVIVVSTNELPDTTPPQNVSALQVVGENGGARLTWSNPPQDDLDRIRVVRSDRFFPIDGADGMVVYEGRAESYLDTSLSSDVTRYYYSVFAIDENNNRSSGAVVLYVVGDESVSIADDIAGQVVVESGTWRMFFGQEKNIWEHDATTTISIQARTPFSLYIPKEELSPYLKTIIVTLLHLDTQTSFSFIVRSTADRAGYKTILSGLEDVGAYSYTVDVIDFNVEKVTRATGTIVVTPAVSGDVGLDIKMYHYILVSFMLLLMFITYRKLRSV